MQPLSLNSQNQGTEGHLCQVTVMQQGSANVQPYNIEQSIMETAVQTCML